MLHIDIWRAVWVRGFKKKHVRLCLELNKGQRKCYVNCVGRVHRRPKNI